MSVSGRESTAHASGKMYDEPAKVGAGCARNGPVTVLQKGESTYTIYARSSTGESGASYSGPSGQIAKYNLGR
jgi:hypothetical protein